MSVNLRLGQADPASIVDLVRTRDVDVLTLQEFTPAAEAALAGAGLTALLPYGRAQPVDRRRGLGRLLPAARSTDGGLASTRAGSTRPGLVGRTWAPGR